MTNKISILDRFLTVDVHDENDPFTAEEEQSLEDLLDEPYENWDLDEERPTTLYNLIIANLDVIEEMHQGNGMVESHYSKYFGQSHFDPDPMMHKSVIGHLNQAIHVQNNLISEATLAGVVSVIDEINIINDHEYKDESFSDMFDRLLGDLSTRDPETFRAVYDEINSKMFTLTNQLNDNAPRIIEIFENKETPELIKKVVHVLLDDIAYILDETATVITDEKELNCHAFTILSNSLEYLTDYLSNIE